MQKLMKLPRSRVTLLAATVALTLAVSANASSPFGFKITFGPMPAERMSLSINAPMCTEIETPFGSIWIVRSGGD